MSDQKNVPPLAFLHSPLEARVDVSPDTVMVVDPNAKSGLSGDFVLFTEPPPAAHGDVLYEAQSTLSLAGAAVLSEKFRAIGLVCSVCGLPQYDTPHGVTCQDGHGGVPGVDPRPEVVPPDETAIRVWLSSVQEALASSDIDSIKAEALAVIAEVERDDFLPATSEAVQLLNSLLGDTKQRFTSVKQRYDEVVKPLVYATDVLRGIFRPTLDTLEKLEKLLKGEILATTRAIEDMNRAALQEAQAKMEAGDSRGAAIVASTLQASSLPEGTHTRKGWDYSVVDLAKVPREFLSLDTKKVRAHIAKHGDSVAIPGILITPKTTLVAKKG